MSNIDISPFEKKVKEIENSLSIANMKKALMKGANVLKRQAVANLKRKVGHSATRYHITKGGKMKLYSIEKGVRATKYKKSRDEANMAVVATHIMGDFRLKFFEMGTKERIRKDGRRTGSIQKGKFVFFDTAVSTKTDEAYKVIRKELEKLL